MARRKITKRVITTLTNEVTKRLRATVIITGTMRIMGKREADRAAKNGPSKRASVEYSRVANMTVEKVYVESDNYFERLNVPNIVGDHFPINFLFF